MKDNRKVLYIHYMKSGQPERAEEVVRGSPDEKAEYDKLLEVKPISEEKKKKGK